MSCPLLAEIGIPTKSAQPSAQHFLGARLTLVTRDDRRRPEITRAPRAKVGLGWQAKLDAVPVARLDTSARIVQRRNRRVSHPSRVEAPGVTCSADLYDDARTMYGPIVDRTVNEILSAGEETHLDRTVKLQERKSIQMPRRSVCAIVLDVQSPTRVVRRL